MSTSSNSASTSIPSQESTLIPNRSRDSGYDLDKPPIETSFAPSPAIPSPPHISRQTMMESPSVAKLRRRGTRLWDSRRQEVLASDGLESPIPATSPTPAFKWMKGETIGRGKFGKVYLAMDLTTGEMIAVKQVEMQTSESDREDQRQKAIIDALKFEGETLKNLNHSNIVQYLGVEQTPEFLSVFMEYVSGGSIGACLRKQGKLGALVVKSFTSQIIDGLEYLHQQNILHRDLKADSILVDPHGICKISGFGTSKRSSAGKVYDPDESATAMEGTVYWMAPEVINSAGGGYSAKVDIWSLGCVWQEMATGERPWKNQDMFYVLNRLGRDKETPPLPGDVVILPEDARIFRDACFTADPHQRPSARDLKSYPYLILPSGWKFTGLTD